MIIALGKDEFDYTEDLSPKEQLLEKDHELSDMEEKLDISLMQITPSDIDPFTKTVHQKAIPNEPQLGNGYAYVTSIFLYYDPIQTGEPHLLHDVQSAQSLELDTELNGITSVVVRDTDLLRLTQRAERFPMEVALTSEPSKNRANGKKGKFPPKIAKDGSTAYVNNLKLESKQSVWFGDAVIQYSFEQLLEDLLCPLHKNNAFRRFVLKKRIYLALARGDREEAKVYAGWLNTDRSPEYTIQFEIWKDLEGREEASDEEFFSSIATYLDPQSFKRGVASSLIKREMRPDDVVTQEYVNELARNLYRLASHSDTCDFQLDYSDRLRLGEQLRQLRRSLGISLRELDKKTKLSKGHLSEIEGGASSITKRFIPRCETLYEYLSGLYRALKDKQLIKQ